MENNNKQVLNRKSKLDELIQQYCPNGVEYKSLGELGTFYGGLTGKSKEDFSDGNASFITYRNVYSNPALDIHPTDKVRIGADEKQRTLQYGDVIFTGSSETPDECGFSSVVTEIPTEPLYLNSFCFFLRIKDLSVFDPDYLKHVFRSWDLRKQIGRTANGVTRFNVSKEKMEKVIIPVPPLPVQQEIVRILDKFTELEAELEAELLLRQKQYEWYRDQLLTFRRNGETDVPLLPWLQRLLDQYAPNGVEWKKLGEVCFVEKGNTPIQKAVPGKYPLVVTASNRSTSNVYQFDKPGVCIPLVSSRGHGVASLNELFYQDGEYAVGNILCCAIPKDGISLSAKYLHAYLNHKKDILLVSQMRGGANVSLPIESILRVLIPIPPLEVQDAIVSVLDKFSELCTDISSGLPAETQALHKQYEYYRDKILSFDNV